MRRKPQDPEYWVSNISHKDVSLGDLRVKVPRGRTINLLDKRHYCFTIAQLRKSAESGSIAFKTKGNLVRVREGEPQKPPTKLQEIERHRQVLRPLRNKVDVDASMFEELYDDDDSREAEERFAAEMAEADYQERMPALAVDKKYRNAKKADE